MNPLEEIGRGFRGATGATPVFLAVFVAVLVALIVILLIVRRRTSPAARADRFRKDLLRRLAEASGLTSAERDLLAHITKHYQIDDPIEIFLKRSLFEAALPVLRLDLAVADQLRRKLYS